MKLDARISFDLLDLIRANLTKELQKHIQLCVNLSTQKNNKHDVCAFVFQDSTRLGAYYRDKRGNKHSQIGDNTRRT
jgi:hypothetical protein